MTLERSTRARLTTAIVLLLVLGSGVVLGVALDRRLEARNMAGEGARTPNGRPEMDGRNRGFDPRSRGPSQPRDSSQHRPSMIVDQVGLSDAQKEQVDSIVGYYRAQMRTLHEEFDEAYSTRYRELNQKAREEVRAVLTEEQRMAYDSLQAVWTQRRQERRQDSIPAESHGQAGTGGLRN